MARPRFARAAVPRSRARPRAWRSAISATNCAMASVLLEIDDTRQLHLRRQIQAPAASRLRRRSSTPSAGAATAPPRRAGKRQPSTASTSAQSSCGLRPGVGSRPTRCRVRCARIASANSRDRQRMGQQQCLHPALGAAPSWVTQASSRRRPPSGNAGAASTRASGGGCPAGATRSGSSSASATAAAAPRSRVMRGGRGRPHRSATQVEVVAHGSSLSSLTCITRCGRPRCSAATQARARSSAWMWLVYTSSSATSAGVPRAQPLARIAAGAVERIDARHAQHVTRTPRARAVAAHARFGIDAAARAIGARARGRGFRRSARRRNRRRRRWCWHRPCGRTPPPRASARSRCRVRGSCSPVCTAAAPGAAPHRPAAPGGQRGRLIEIAHQRHGTGGAQRRAALRRRGQRQHAPARRAAGAARAGRCRRSRRSAGAVGACGSGAGLSGDRVMPGR